MSDPVVSICCITYQHAAFIRKALEGFLMQRTDFPFEVIVHDDASSDGTAAIVREFAERDSRIRAVLRETNIKSTGVPVFPITYGMARGKYIAVCEGDDFWTDPLKLQKQVDYMQANPDAAGCFTDAWNEQAGIRSSYLGERFASSPQGLALHEGDLVRNPDLPFCTFLFRRDFARPIPEAMYRSPVGDTILYLHLAGMGPLRYLPGHTAVRNIHPGGIHSMTGRLHRTRVKEATWPLMDQMTGGRYQAEFKRMYNRMYASEWNKALAAGDRPVLRHIWPKVLARRQAYGWSRARTALNFCKARLPLLGKLLASITGR